MKIISLALVLTATLLSFKAIADHEPTTMPYGFSKVYAPHGFDSNDNVQIVLAGMFPNSCYRYADTQFKVDSAAKTITLNMQAYFYDGMCLQVMMPFDHTVDLGILKQGTYSILSGKDTSPVGQISIASTSSREADDYLYAPISQAFFKAQNSHNYVYLTGEFPLSCMKIKEVKYSFQDDVLVIQPIAELNSSKPCTDGKFPFETLVEIQSLPPGRHLLHVRSMNGKSVNSIINTP